MDLLKNKNVLIIGLIAVIGLVLFFLLNGSQQQSAGDFYSQEVSPLLKKQGFSDEYLHNNSALLYSLDSSKLNLLRNDFSNIVVTTDNDFHKKLVSSYISLIDVVKLDKEFVNEEIIFLKEDFDCALIPVFERRNQKLEELKTASENYQTIFYELNESYPNELQELEFSGFQNSADDVFKGLELDKIELLALKESCQ